MTLPLGRGRLGAALLLVVKKSIQLMYRLRCSQTGRARFEPTNGIHRLRERDRVTGRPRWSAPSFDLTPSDLSSNRSAAVRRFQAATTDRPGDRERGARR